MNVLRVTRNFPPLDRIKYGIEPTVYYISREHVRMGLNVHTICKRNSQEKKYEEIDGIKIHRVPAPFNLTMLHKLSKLNKEMQIDIIHSHATSGFSYALLRKLWKMGSHRPKYVIHVHGTTKGIMLAMRKSFLKFERAITKETFMWRNADVLITNSKFLKAELISLYGISKKKIYVAYNGIDPNTFYPRKTRSKIFKMLGLWPKTKLILYLGGFRPVKGPKYVVDAIKEVYNEMKDVVLLFVGGEHPIDRYYKETMMRDADYLAKKRVIRFVKNIPHTPLPDYYSAVDAVVVPSIYDAFPKVVLEAMACGTPVIASNVGGIPELISHDETGILVEPANPDKLAEAIITTVLNSDLREKLSFKGRRLVKERFTWEQVAKRILTVYKKLISATNLL